MKVIIFDGGMGSMLYSMDIISECNELLNLTRPYVISDIHRQYHEAGASYIKTNTFGASPLKLRKSKNDHLSYDINRAAVDLAGRYSSQVAGDIGPSGELYYPYGNYSTEDIYNSFLTQVKGFNGVSCFLIETMSSVVEANLAYLAVKKLCPEIPIILSFTFDKGRTMMGCSAELISKAFHSYDLMALGTNCSGGPYELRNTVTEFASYSVHTVSSMPNAGLPVCDNDKIHYPVAPDEFALAIEDHLNIGAGIIGGCCGTTPSHIEKLAHLKGIEVKLDAVSDNDKYIATERIFRSIKDAVNTNPDDDDILNAEAIGKVARVDVSKIDNLNDYMENLNTLSSQPKCFIAREEQEETIRILYQGITDIEII